MLLRLPITLALLVFALALPASAIAQSNAGQDQYIEDPGSVPGGGSPGTIPPGTEGTATGPGSSGVAGVSGTADGSTSEAAAAEAARASGNLTADGTQLPASGSETAVLALIGAGLVAGGLLLRRRAGQPA